MSPSPKGTVNNSFKARKEVTSPAIKKWFVTISNLASNTYDVYRRRCYVFDAFCSSVYNKTVDELIADMKAGKENRYECLSALVSYTKSGKYSGREPQANYVRDTVKIIRQFLEFSGVEYSDSQLRVHVKLPRKEKPEKEPTTKTDIRDLLLATSAPFLRTYLLCLGATGMRPIEAASIKQGNLDFKSIPPRINIEAKYTKMRKARYVYMTGELANAIQALLKYKHRPRRNNVVVDPSTGKLGGVIVNPVYDPTDLLFSIYRRPDMKHKKPKVNSLKRKYAEKMNDLVDAIGKGDREVTSNMRKLTRYTLRRFAKSTISDLGFADFSEWYIGHEASTYYRAKEEQRVAVFRKIESYLTFADFTSLELLAQDNQSRIAQLEIDKSKLQLDVADMRNRLLAITEAGAMRDMGAGAGVGAAAASSPTTPTTPPPPSSSSLESG